jgi:UDP-N-acetylmuramate-alanine ligase
VSGETIIEKAKKMGHPNARYIEKKADIARTIAAGLKSGDAVVVMGAGDINEICRDILEEAENA